jgi:hypothetical protein
MPTQRMTGESFALRCCFSLATLKQIVVSIPGFPPGAAFAWVWMVGIENSVRENWPALMGGAATFSDRCGSAKRSDLSDSFSLSRAQTARPLIETTHHRFEMRICCAERSPEAERERAVAQKPFRSRRVDSSARSLADSSKVPKAPPATILWLGHPARMSASVNAVCVYKQR